MKIRSLTVVGGGNGAHALAALASARGLEVRIWAPLPEEAELIRQGTAQQGGIKAVSAEGQVSLGLPARIDSDPQKVIPGSEAVVFVLPAFTHKQLFARMSEHLSPGTIVGAIPSRSGFEFLACSLAPPGVTIFGLQTLPWACRIKEYGKQVEILGTKNQVAAASLPANQAAVLCDALQDLLGLPVLPMPNMLAVSLANMGQVIHPGIMYGLFRQWDGQPFPENRIPLFYQGVTEEMCGILERLSFEILEIKAVLEKDGGFDLTGVTGIREWIINSYRGSIEDSSTLMKCFNTNKGYRGLKAPVRKRGNEGYVPDFSSRYLTEDVPYGLVVSRGLAELAGVATPMMDEVITAAGRWMGKEYLAGGKLEGKDLGETPIPQNYGIVNMDSLCRIVF
ncbi:MAG: NAD/NADP octopine/nopaline dehydrogenase family protein [Peptococcaceae bacterium]|jgi:hypothetical protein|nr:NAD/NADP octopine/nopaline dehydrogenase family protein [Peptococcaceae bacterium]MDH7523889.1 NAD/NADP octopine/nopaline dehydrogenase family protein [Peptococcaceae bacterium]